MLAPLRIEARALRAGAPGLAVRRTGMGPRRSRAAAGRLAGEGAVVIAGFAGALSPEVRPGDVVVATEVRGPDADAVLCAGAAALAEALAGRGLRVHSGPIASSPRLVSGAARKSLAATGALAVDMESAWLAAGTQGRPVAVVRAIVDAPGRELRSPVATIRGARLAYRALRHAAPALRAAMMA